MFSFIFVFGEFNALRTMTVWDIEIQKRRIQLYNKIKIYNILYTPEPCKITFITLFNIYNYSSSVFHRPRLTLFFQIHCKTVSDHGRQKPFHMLVGTSKTILCCSYQTGWDRGTAIEQFSRFASDHRLTTTSKKSMAGEPNHDPAEIVIGGNLQVLSYACGEEDNEPMKTNLLFSRGKCLGEFLTWTKMKIVNMK